MSYAEDLRNNLLHFSREVQGMKDDVIADRIYELEEEASSVVSELESLESAVSDLDTEIYNLRASYDELRLSSEALGKEHDELCDEYLYSFDMLAKLQKYPVVQVLIRKIKEETNENSSINKN